ncbi:NAD(P)-dependent oxidoreductase [uncultured Megasphaera sp.]|uniref:NAD-dependent epimerase/dehydratase family protein n=1 Tax=uncultured Megasphaera sp. TaxID=165188 RepID=UPI00262735E1|nr:NAD-dependent epimerase/dehydratase family protein [uncultured Megasphaera sp.]
MWIENKVFKEDLENIIQTPCINWKTLQGKTVLVTGGTGLIGSTLINSLLYANQELSLGLQVLALIRNQKKAEQLFFQQLQADCPLSFIYGTVENLPDIEGPVDYIIHGASPTASAFFVDHPVETIEMNVFGTTNLLHLANKKKISGFIYLSSMEVYGSPLSDQLIDETQGTTLDTMSIRSCYPEAKRLCESLCASYAKEYGIPTFILRLVQTFGPGVAENDARVFAEFARCVLLRKNIVLQTEGTSKRCYLYTADAVTAILTVLLSGKSGEAYNAANPETYCSIVEMAQLVATKLAQGSIQVDFDIDENNEKKFPPPHNLKLSIRKISALGWKPSTNLLDMYQRLIMGMLP